MIIARSRGGVISGRAAQLSSELHSSRCREGTARRNDSVGLHCWSTELSLKLGNSVEGKHSFPYL